MQPEDLADLLRQAEGRALRAHDELFEAEFLEGLPVVWRERVQSLRVDADQLRRDLRAAADDAQATKGGDLC